MVKKVREMRKEDLLVKLVKSVGKPWKARIIQVESTKLEETNKSITDGVLRHILTSETLDVDKLLAFKGEEIQELLVHYEFEEQEIYLLRTLLKAYITSCL